MFFGNHRCSPELVHLKVGGVRGPHLLVGEEGGHLLFFSRHRLSSESYPDGQLQDFLYELLFM
jgi:hypothetical protein